MTDPLRRWIHERSHVRSLRRSHIATQRRRSLLLLLFGIVRIIAWMILGACVILGLAHMQGFGWAKVLSESVPFVSMISIYANWATDLDAATAAFAALVAADSHSAVEASREMLSVDVTAIEEDIARLAAMQPGPEAIALAAQIRQKLPPPPGK
jgi:hypothetical protein